MLRCGSEFHLRFNAFQRLHHLTNGCARACEHTCKICELSFTEYYLITTNVNVLALHYFNAHSWFLSWVRGLTYPWQAIKNWQKCFTKKSHRNILKLLDLPEVQFFYQFSAKIICWHIPRLTSYKLIPAWIARLVCMCVFVCGAERCLYKRKYSHSKLASNVVLIH